MKTTTFEQKLELAKEYIEKLMDKDVTLEESIELYKKAQIAIAQAQKMLEEAKLKVEDIKKSKSGVSE